MILVPKIAQFSSHTLGGVASNTETSDPTVRNDLMGASGLGSASLATVAPDPSVFSYGETDTADQLSQMNTVANQWGSAIASISTVATNTGSTTQVNVVNPVGAAAVANNTPSVGSLLLLAAVVIGIYLLVKE
jgi:hypothetical protein